MAEPAEAHATSGQLIAGRYELLEQIAVGGMGTVWSADDRKLGRMVALKVMRPRSLEAFDDAHQRFEREAKAAAALRSSHVVAVHDYGVDDDLPFIAMELLEGESLKARMSRLGALSVHDTAEILRQAVKGLKAAHTAGLVHRDLKPSNIFIAQRDDTEVVKLLDFGVVKEAMTPKRDSDETASGVLLGTPQYMSPEQARGHRKIDHRADLWSLAVIAYEMLTGENPFDSEAEAVGDIVIRVCVEPITPPSVLEPDLPPQLDRFFERALDRSPGKRFQSARELFESFLVSADLSFAGVSDISMDGQVSLSPAPPISVSESASFNRLEDPPTMGGSMATPLPGEEVPGSTRRVVMVALVAAMGVGTGIASHMLMGGNASSANEPRPASSAAMPGNQAPAASSQPDAPPAPAASAGAGDESGTATDQKTDRPNAKDASKPTTTVTNVQSRDVPGEVPGGQRAAPVPGNAKGGGKAPDETRPGNEASDDDQPEPGSGGGPPVWYKKGS